MNLSENSKIETVLLGLLPSRLQSGSSPAISPGRAVFAFGEHWIFKYYGEKAAYIFECENRIAAIMPLQMTQVLIREERDV